MRILALILAIALAALPAVAADLTTYKVQINATGDDGSATGTATTEMLPGYLEDVYLDYASDATPSTDVTLAYATRGGTFLTVSNTRADSLVTPRVKPVDNATASITNAYDRFPLWDKVTVSLAQGTAATPSVTVYLRVLRP